MRQVYPNDHPKKVKDRERFKEIVSIIRGEFKDADEWIREHRLHRGQMNAIGRHRLEKCGMLEFLDKIYHYHKSTGINIGLAYVLWHYIETNTPQYFLELGTGVSTHIIAEAMKRFCYDKYDGDIKLVSMESDKGWYEEALKHPTDDFVEIVLSPMEESRVGLFLSNGYREIPDYQYDTVFLDGPSQDAVVNLDVVDISKRIEKDFVVIIDSRIQTVLALFLIYGSKYLNRLGNVFLLGPINKYTLEKYVPSGENRLHDLVQERIAQLILPHIESGIE